MWHPDANTYSIFATLGLNITIAVLCMVVFEYLRNYQLDIYSPKLRRPGGGDIPKPGTNLFGWILPVWRASDEQVLRIAGMDAYVLLRHMKMCYRICLCSAIGAVILLAIYYTSFEASHHDDDDEPVIGIAQFSMANVPNKGRRLWGSVVFVYLFTFIFLYFIDVEYANFAQMRTKYSKGGMDGLPAQMHYSVQVENIPSDFRTSPRLREFMQSIFPDEVLHVYVAISLTSLEKLVSERAQLLARLEDSIAAWEADDRQTRPLLLLNKGVLPPPHTLCYGGDDSVDAIDYLSDQIAILSAEISELQSEARQLENGEERRLNRSSSSWLKISDTLRLTEAVRAAEDLKAVEYLKKVSDRVTTIGGKLPGELDSKIFTAIQGFPGSIASRLVSATGFVTFRSKRSQAVAVGLSALSAQYPDLQVSPAPAPTDIIWANLSASTEHTEAMTYMTSGLYYTGLVFWTAALAFIAGLSNLQHLAEYMPFLNSLDETSYAVLQGILPVVVMMVFLSLVPYAMGLISQHIERRKTLSSIHEQVFKWFFLYQIANVYLLLLAGSAVTSVSDIIDNPADILYTISTALPTTSVFFINYVITTAFTGVTTNYLQIVPMLYFACMRILFPEKRFTRRSLFEGPLAPISVNYGASLPDGLYVLCVVLLYWVIAPIIIFVGMCYFGAAYLCWKYQFLYVIERSYESGGKFWYGLYDYSMVALLASTVTIIAYMSIKEGIAQAPALVPALVIVLYQWRRTESRYREMSMKTPYSAAVEVDTNPDSASVIDEFTEDYLKQPCMIAPVRISPYPYRIRGIPLINEEGLVHEIYLSEQPPEEAQCAPLGPLGDYNPPRAPHGSQHDAAAVEATVVSAIHDEEEGEVDEESKEHLDTLSPMPSTFGFSTPAPAPAPAPKPAPLFSSKSVSAISSKKRGQYNRATSTQL